MLCMPVDVYVYNCIGLLFLVHTIGEQRCTRSSQIQVKSGISYIASVLTQETGCGLGSKPWILEAQPGQRINLTLLDFAWKERKTWISDCQHVYGHVLEVDNEVYIWDKLLFLFIRLCISNII